jgi:hypothetical protein
VSESVQERVPERRRTRSRKRCKQSGSVERHRDTGPECWGEGEIVDHQQRDEHMRLPQIRLVNSLSGELRHSWSQSVSSPLSGSLHRCISHSRKRAYNVRLEQVLSCRLEVSLKLALAIPFNPPTIHPSFSSLSSLFAVPGLNKVTGPVFYVPFACDRHPIFIITAHEKPSFMMQMVIT